MEELDIERIRVLYLDKKSIHDIHKETGIPLSSIFYNLRKLSVLRSRKDAVCIAAKEGKLSSAKGTKRIFTEEWKKNISKGKILYADKYAKGVSLKPNGYLEITRGKNKGRSVHCVKIEQFIGRRMFANECVHHKDGNRSNNKITNLEIMTRAEHCSIHSTINNHKRKRDKKGRYDNGKC